MGHCYDAWIKPFFITNHKYINKNVVSFILVWLQYNTHILKLRIKDFANFQAKKARNWFNWAKIKSNRSWRGYSEWGNKFFRLMYCGMKLKIGSELPKLRKIVFQRGIQTEAYKCFGKRRHLYHTLLKHTLTSNWIPNQKLSTLQKRHICTVHLKIKKNMDSCF